MFVVNSKRWNHGAPPRFCSRSCASESRITLLPFNCPRCGTLVKKPGQRRQKYCSVDCSRESQKGKKQKREPVGNQERCKSCGSADLGTSRVTGKPLLHCRACADRMHLVPRFEIICDSCGRTAIVSRRGQRHCSVGCAARRWYTSLSEYTIWRSLKERCEDPRKIAYKWYGARGISVCKEWSESFEAFYSSMGPRPSVKHSIDRINNDGNYEPGNCRWATTIEQSRNRSNTIRVTINGDTKTLPEWSEISGIRLGTLWFRLKHGWSPDQLLKPTRNQRASQ